MFIELNSFDGCLSNLGHFRFRNGWFVVVQGIQLAIEGFHSLHVVGAEAPSPAAEEAAATALGGESETGAAARPRGGAPAGDPAAATRDGSGRASTGGEGLPQGQRGPGMAARAGGAPVWGTQALPGRVGSGRGRGWAAAPSLLRPARSRSSAL